MCACVHQQSWDRGEGQADYFDSLSISLKVSQAPSALLDVLRDSVNKSCLDRLQCKPH